MGESGGSAERMAQTLAASGDDAAAAWAAGAEGERRVAEALADLPDDFLVLHDRLLLPGVTESNVDHLVVGATGLILIDAKNWGGYVSEHNGTLFQHTLTAGGERRHRPRHRELSRVEWMATEVALRLQHGVTAAICLAGKHAAQFGEPRVVQNVWVVPLPHLVGWVRSLPRRPEWDVEVLKVRARTEFPSTTTDPELLAAIGVDLSRTMVRRPETATGAGRPATRTSRAGTSRRRPGRPAPARRPSRLRPALGLIAVLVLLWTAGNGLLSSLAVAGGAAVSKVALGGTGSAIRSSTPDHLSCEDFDPSAAKVLRKTALTAKPSSSGCAWSLAGSKAGAAPVIVLAEVIGSSEKLNPMLDRARKAGTAEVHQGWALGGRCTVLWVAAGVPVGPAKTIPVSTRSMTVQVAWERLRLNETQGQQLASSIARSVSSHHRPTPPTPSA